MRAIITFGADFAEKARSVLADEIPDQDTLITLIEESSDLGIIDIEMVD